MDTGTINFIQFMRLTMCERCQWSCHTTRVCIRSDFHKKHRKYSVNFFFLNILHPIFLSFFLNLFMKNETSKNLRKRILKFEFHFYKIIYFQNFKSNVEYNCVVQCEFRFAYYFQCFCLFNIWNICCIASDLNDQ